MLKKGEIMQFLKNAYSPYEEMIAYEVLCSLKGNTTKRVSELFAEHKTLPSALLKYENGLFEDNLKEAVKEFINAKLGSFSVMLNNSFQYPERIRDAQYPLELFYYKGDIGLLESKAISIVGARECSEDGLKRAKKLTKLLVNEGYTIVSGLAKGVDTVAHTSAIEMNGNTIGVIGTPIDQYYPKENKELQDLIASKYLLISQVPFYKYKVEPFVSQKNYFPERNATMAAISEATVIVEASDTSGTLTQARACIHQGRKLFILNSCFENPDIKWPHTYLKKGAIRVHDFEDIIANMK